MPQTIPLGVAATLAQNVSYALPSNLVYVSSSAPVQTSLDNSAWTALTGAETTGALSGALFIRCPGGSATVVCKKGIVNQAPSSTNLVTTGNIQVGVNPAQSGAIRLANNQAVMARNQANTSDVPIASMDSTNSVVIGPATMTKIGHIVPTIDNQWNMGNGSLRFKQAYFTNSVAVGVKAGVPTDADVTGPVDGMVLIDTTNNKIMVRIGGVWKGVVVA